jgi:exosortase E/protease (VPEID-CTERM system)
VWAVLLIGLLLAELLGLTFRFDTGSLYGNDTWWARLLGHAPVVARLAAVIGVATLFFGGGRLRAAYRQLPARHHSGPVWPFLLAHLAAFTGLAMLTALLLEGEAQSLPWTGAWVLGWFVLVGLTLAMWAAALLPAGLWLPLARQGALPLLGGAVIGALAWGAGELTDFLWPPLSHWTFWTVRGLLGLLVRDPICEPADFVIGTRQFSVRIAPECSGYEGIGLIWVFLAAYLWLHRGELYLGRVLLLLPLATVGIWFVNAARITALIALGTWGSRAVATGGFHSQAGWLAFNAIALGMVVLTQHVGWFHKHRSAAPARTAAPAFLAPLLALLAVLMVTAAFQSGFDWLYPVRVVVVGAVLLYFRRQYTGLFRSWSWQAVAIGGVVFFLWMALEPAAPEQTRTALPDALADSPVGWAVVWLVFRVVGSVVTAPLAEELAFRGYLPRRLQAADFETVPLGRFTWASFLISSVLFGLLHGRWLAGTLAGMFYAVALYRRGNLAEPLLAHAVTNALIAAYVLATGTWSLWS